MTTAAELAGRLVIGGFEGTELPEDLRKALSEGRRGGVILFRRNIPTIDHASALCRATVAAARDGAPLIGIDEEGGRVRRLPSPPALALPPMRTLGGIGDPFLARRAAFAMGRELAAIGVNWDFSPVLDVDSNPENPVIGDRSFSRDPSLVTRLGVQIVEGLEEAGVLSCAKHFPGHGDTSQDSHFDLPFVDHERARLDAVELTPFRLLAKRLSTIMSAHVVYRALDPDKPATLSRRIATDLLRGELGFEGVLVSDDLEMRAVADRLSVEEIAVQAVLAGCDALLVCKSLDVGERAHSALVSEIEKSPAFRSRAEEASTRVTAAATRFPSKPADPKALAEIVGSAESRAIADEIARRAPRS